MQYTINNKDLKAIFGITVTSGAASLLAMPKRKDSVSHNWPEQDGTDTDLGDPHFEARDLKLSFMLVANSRADFKTKLFAFYAELKRPDNLALYSADIDQTFSLFFKEQQNFKKVLKRIDANKVAVTFDIVFGENNPADNLEAVFLVDENDNYIIG